MGTLAPAIRAGLLPGPVYCLRHARRDVPEDPRLSLPPADSRLTRRFPTSSEQHVRCISVQLYDIGERHR